LPEVSTGNHNDILSSVEEKQLRHAEKLLQNSLFSEAMELYDCILSSNVECAEAYLGKLMAELHVCGKEPFRSYFSEHIVYNHVNFKFAEEYADPSLKIYLQSLSLPNCKNHRTVASCVCTQCNSLICNQCSHQIVYQSEDAPWPSGQILCSECVKMLHKHSEVMVKRNRRRILLFFAGITLGLILPTVQCIIVGKVETFFLILGIEGFLVATVKKTLYESIDTFSDGYSPFDLLIWFITLVFRLVLWELITPVWILWKCTQNLYWILKMKELIKADELAAENEDQIYTQYVDTYFKLVNITRALHLEEPIHIDIGH